MATIFDHQRHDTEREANRWLARRLQWEDRLAQLEAGAGHAPAKAVSASSRPSTPPATSRRSLPPAAA